MEAYGAVPKNIISQRLNYYDLSEMRDKWFHLWNLSVWWSIFQQSSERVMCEAGMGPDFD